MVGTTLREPLEATEPPAVLAATPLMTVGICSLFDPLPPAEATGSVSIVVESIFCLFNIILLVDLVVASCLVTEFSCCLNEEVGDIAAPCLSVMDVNP